MNELMLQLKKHGVTMNIYPNSPITNGFLVKFGKMINTEMVYQEHLIDIDMLIGPYLSIDKILIVYLQDFIKSVNEKYKGD